METAEERVPIRLSYEREVAVMDSIYDFVMRTTANSEKATPAEVGILPEMIKCSSTIGQFSFRA